MPTDIEFQEIKNGRGFCAMHNGQKIGEINTLYVGNDRLIIESTTVNTTEYDMMDVCLYLVRCVANFARAQHRKIITMCPRAQSVFNRYPEFDDLRFFRVEK